MRTHYKEVARSGRRWLTISAAVLAGGLAVAAQSATINLTGKQEVPSVVTGATGTGHIIVRTDRSVHGSVTTSGVHGTAAHIHAGAAGKNGPVIIPLKKTSANTWVVPTGAKLTKAQYARYRAGDLYVNVHSAAHPGGEIRGQIAPDAAAAPAMPRAY